MGAVVAAGFGMLIVAGLAIVAIRIARSAVGTDPHDREPDVEADGRLRFVLFRPAGASFTIDAVVDDEGSGRLGRTGSAVTLRLHRPAAPREELALEAILRQWADEDRLVDVTLGEDSSITTLQADGSRTRLHLVS